MEELDLLKKDWNRKDRNFTQVSETEIYKMTHYSSSSIVKWLLVISIIEFTFWGILTLAFNDEKYQLKLHRYGIEDCLFWLNVVNYIVLVAFIYFFYRNYKKISTTDDTRTLMVNILNTRRTVKYYIGYNLGIVALNIVLSVLMLFLHNKQMQSMLHEAAEKGHEQLFVIICAGVSILFIMVIIGIFWLFYKLLYGILLKKLFVNYKELQKIDLG